jgi:hypothetical protein
MGEVQDGGETEAISKKDFNKSKSPPSFHWLIYNERIRLLCLNVSKQYIFCNNILKSYVIFLIYTYVKII